jgi:hypothetical protein
MKPLQQHFLTDSLIREELLNLLVNPIVIAIACSKKDIMHQLMHDTKNTGSITLLVSMVNMGVFETVTF